MIAKLKNRLSRARIEHSAEPADKAVAEFFRALTDEKTAASAWRSFAVLLEQYQEQFTRGLGNHLSGERQLQMLKQLLIPVGQVAFGNGATWLKLFDLAEQMKIHLLPVNYYSPVPDSQALPEHLWSRRFDAAINFDATAQLALLNRLAPWGVEMADTPRSENEAQADQYCWLNPAFNPVDGVIYYSMIREFKPARVIEIGGGYSTLISTLAARRNGATHVECIEPAPPKFLTERIPGLSRLIVTHAQAVPLEIFESLESNDILFVDSCHVSRIGSEVHRIFFEILPRLKPGVLVHFHDIFLPWDYPRDWAKELKIFWNEQYLLLAFLMCNETFQPLLANHYLLREQLTALQRAFPFLPRWDKAGSFWMRCGNLSTGMDKPEKPATPAPPLLT